MYFLVLCNKNLWIKKEHAVCAVNVSFHLSFKTYNNSRRGHLVNLFVVFDVEMYIHTFSWYTKLIICIFITQGINPSYDFLSFVSFSVWLAFPAIILCLLKQVISPAPYFPHLEQYVLSTVWSRNNGTSYILL